MGDYLDLWADYLGSLLRNANQSIGKRRVLGRERLHYAYCSLNGRLGPGAIDPEQKTHACALL